MFNSQDLGEKNSDSNSTQLQSWRDFLSVRDRTPLPVPIYFLDSSDKKNIYAQILHTYIF